MSQAAHIIIAQHGIKCAYLLIKDVTTKYAVYTLRMDG